MFSAFKKLTNRNDGGQPPGGPVSPGAGGVQSMGANLQRKFARGCNYNMKIVIRGDRNTGKSGLLARLQGKPFQEQYIPTEEIQVASINWSYKNTEDIVKVEVWDVVDVAKKRKKLDGLKMAEEAEQPGLDAEFIDVYKGTHGAVLLLDITKLWTFDYVKKECEKVPVHIPILILANFADMSHHRQVTRLQVAGFVENLVREGQDPAEVRWAESSLRNGFGLKLLHNFLNVPFLTLQRQSLLQQLQVNQRDIIATQEELDLYMDSDDANYEKFSDNLTKRRRQNAELAAPPPTASIVAGQPSNVIDPAKSSQNFTVSNSTMSYSNRSNLSSDQVPTTVSRSPVPTLESHAQRSPGNQATTNGLDSPTKQGKDSAPTKQGKDSAPTRHSKEPSPLSTGKQSKEASPVASAAAASVRSGKVDVDNFIPDSGDFDTFLDEEISHPKPNTAVSNQNVDSSDDEDNGNPMVAKFQDDIDDDSYDDNDAINNITAAIQADSSSDEEEQVQNLPNIYVVKPKNEDVPSPSFESLNLNGSSTEKAKVQKNSEPGDDLEDFLNDGDNDCDNTGKSNSSAYEAF